MPRKTLLILLTVLSASVGLLGARAGKTRESLLPLLRAGQEHVQQAERAVAVGLPVAADEERMLGREIVSVIGRGARRDSRLEEIGRRMERSGRVPRYAGRYEYRVLPGRIPYAFAVSGGFIFVSQGLLDAMEYDTSRLSFVLGHELAHVELGHTANSVRYRSWLKKWHVPGPRMGQAVREIAALSFSPAQELEADRLSLEMMRIADYRLEGSVEFFERVQTVRPWEGGTHRAPGEVLAEGLFDYFKTHPGERERVERLRGMIGPRAPSSAAVTSPAPVPSGDDLEGFFTGEGG